MDRGGIKNDMGQFCKMAGYISLDRVQISLSIIIQFENHTIILPKDFIIRLPKHKTIPMFVMQL